MRYRRLTATGDYQFGQEQADFYIDQPEAVAQAVTTRLRLNLGAFFLDTSDGTDWMGQILGERTSRTRDMHIRERVLLTTGVNAINKYNSGLEPNTRAFAAEFQLDTIYGVFSALRHVFILPTDQQPSYGPSRPTAVVVTPITPHQVNVTWTV